MNSTKKNIVIESSFLDNECRIINVLIQINTVCNENGLIFLYYPNLQHSVSFHVRVPSLQQNNLFEIPSIYSSGADSITRRIDYPMVCIETFDNLIIKKTYFNY